MNKNYAAHQTKNKEDTNRQPQITQVICKVVVGLAITSRGLDRKTELHNMYILQRNASWLNNVPDPS